MTATSPIPTLRPLRLVELLDQAIHLYRRHFWKFVGITAVVQVPLTLIRWVSSAALSSLLITIFTLRTATYYGIASQILNLFWQAINLIGMQGIAMTAMAYTVVNEYLSIPVSIVQAYRKVSLRPIAAVLVALLVSLGLVVWLLVPGIGWLTGLGILVFFFAAIIPLLVPIIVLEKQTAWKSLRRAWNLARRRFWPICGFVIVLFVLERLFVTGPSFLLRYVLTILLALGQIDRYALSPTQMAIESLVPLTLALPWLPIRTTGITLLYLDLRARAEDLDLVLQAMPPTHPAQVEYALTQAPQVDHGNLVTWRELGRFALLSLIVVVGPIVLFALTVFPFYFLNQLS
jgi:hypothetical protein